MRSRLVACLAVVSLASCYAAITPGPDGSDATDGGAAGDDARGATDPREQLPTHPELATAMRRATVSGGEACPDWVPSAHPSPHPPPDAPSGTPTELWTIEIADVDPSRPYAALGLAGDGTLFVLPQSPGTEVFHLDRDGRELWRQSLGLQHWGWAIAPDGTSYYSLWDEPTGRREAVLALAADGGIVGVLPVSATDNPFGISQLGIGPGGRVYAVNGALTATCRGVRAEWRLEVGLVGEAAAVEINGEWTDSTGALLLTISGTTRAARLTDDGRAHEWLGLADVPPPFVPDRVGTWFAAMRGTTAVVVAMTTGTNRLPSLTMPGAAAEALPSNTRSLDGIGRVITSSGGRDSDVWTWTAPDGTTWNAQSPCDGLEVSALTEDGGLLCRGGADLRELRRISPDGEIAWSIRTLGMMLQIALDIDGRVYFQELLDSGSVVVHALQTDQRPPPDHWPGAARHASFWAHDYR
jgi:hypothetical protein